MIRRNDGFALPLAVFFISLLTLLITAAFTKVQSDRRVADSSGSAVDAFAIAESGLQRYLATRSSRPADGDSVRINVTGGYADVVASVIYRPASDTSNVYAVKSTGYHIQPTQGSDPQSSRTLVQFARWQRGTLTYTAVWTAAGTYGLEDYNAAIHGSVGIAGNDTTGCTGYNPNRLRIENNPGWWDAPVGSDVQEGNNPEATIGVTWAQVDTGGFQADYHTLTDLNSWSSYFINGSATLNQSGTGILVVKDSLVITGGTVNWAGIILVGGHIVFNATSTRISGVLATGLANETGIWSTDTKYPTTGKSLYVQHNTCHVRQALDSLTALYPMGGAWVDNWATY